jgi:hypothetical protein
MRYRKRMSIANAFPLIAVLLGVIVGILWSIDKQVTEAIKILKDIKNK